MENFDERFVLREIFRIWREERVDESCTIRSNGQSRCFLDLEDVYREYDPLKMNVSTKGEFLIEFLSLDRTISE